jgi:signal transduction histidine kinase
MAVEEQLRRAEKLSTLGEMAAVLAHEIRNPLGSIRGTAEILKDDYRPGDPKHEFIEIQIRETERLNRVVEDFLRMARPQPSEMTSCSLVEELETVVTLVSRDALKRGVSILFDPFTGESGIHANGEKLRQAFLNIVINALQATPSGGNVTIAINRIESGLEISFIDSGSGIDADSLSKIFDPFFTTKPDGTGLGLAITKKIIESHGGVLTVESEAGKGTIVSVRLPIQAGDTQ